jgi:membrane protein implicated in regulation of membrane protease activity
MIDVFWGCLIGGIIFALITLLTGGLFHKLHGLHHSMRFHGARFLHPTTVVGAITAFGGAGILLLKLTVLAGTPLIAVAAVIALLVSVAVHFGFVMPMERSESSIAFSIQDYRGMQGIATVPIPAAGHGQVMVKMGASNTVQIAASFDGDTIPRGAAVVVVEIQNGVLYVSVIDVH